MKLISIFSAKFKNSKTPEKLFGVSAVIALFFLAFKAPLDPDLFWHLKTGELMWQYKIIPQIDWYSFTMSDFAWINHEWLTEILMYLIKNTFGWAGLAIFFAIIITFIFAWLIPKISRNIETKKSPFYVGFILAILGAVTSSVIFGQRPQIFSFLGVALILYIIKECQINNKNKTVYFLPLLFLLWANMHAGFILGLVLLLVYLVLDKSIRLPAMRQPDADWVKLYKPLSPESWRNLSWLVLLSAAATFINPYGARIYLEIFRTFSDNYGHNIIIEWLSPNFHNTGGLVFAFYLIILFIILSITKKIDLLFFTLLPFFLFFSLQSGRNIPIFVLISLPILIRNLGEIEEIFSSIMQKKLITISMCVLFIFFPPFVNEINNVIKTMYNEKDLASFGKFPQEEAINFLKNYQSTNPKNVLNDYFWGGYLIKSVKCKVESKKLKCEPKVFIDGRMAHWITPERHILKDYVDITNMENNTKELLEKYQIEIIFTDKNLLLGRSLASNNDWRKIYEDELAVIYEKK